MDSRAGRAGRELCEWMRRKDGRLAALLYSSVVLTFHPPSCHSVSHQKNLVELSFLPSHTGELDVFPASLGLPLLKQGERQREAEGRDHKGEEEESKKTQKRKAKRNQKGQEEAQVPSKENKEPQKPQAKKQGKRRLESAREQVRAQGVWPAHLWKGEPFKSRPPQPENGLTG